MRKKNNRRSATADAEVCANTRRVFLSSISRIFSSLSVYLFFLLLPFSLSAQQANVPLNYEWTQESQAQMVKSKGFHLDEGLLIYDTDSALSAIPRDTGMRILLLVTYAAPIHTSMKPWLEQGHPLRKNMILQNAHDHHYHPPAVKHELSFFGKTGVWIKRYHYQNSLLQIEREPQNEEPVFRLYIDPLLNLQYMNVSDDTSSSQFYINTRGVTAHGDIGKKVSFETSFWENQAFFPKYMADFANSSLVVPGQGRWKRFKTTGFDYAMASGYVSWAVCRNFNAQVGHGKFFVGDGYRSLLLSDNSFNYPYARFTGWFGPNKMFQYTTIYASLMNLKSISPVPIGTEKLFQKKAASFYQLSVKIGRSGEISLFQGLIWTAADSSNRQGIKFAYVNPLIFSSIPGNGLSGKNNFLLGATFRYDFLKVLRVYGQFVIDDLGKKGTVHHKTGFQLGVNYFDAFTLKHLHLSFEYNRVNPYTYAATDVPQAYTHYNQPLAHPLGANFAEVSASLQYKIGDFFLQARFSSSSLGADSISENNAGQDPFKSDYFAYYPLPGSTNTFGQGVKTTITYFDARIGYMVSYASNLNIALGYVSRNETFNATSTPTSYVYVAVRTSLTNTYNDFFKK